MSELLPKHIDPWSLYRYRQTLSGHLPLTAMPYLLASQMREDGEASVELSVNQRDDGEFVLAGNASVEVLLECQRCLEPFKLTLEAEIHLVIVKNEKRLAALEEDAIVCEDTLAVAPLIEQEFILALPLIAKHENCEINYQNANISNKTNPFKELKDLLN